MNSELMLDVGQANELKLAFRREGDWTNEEIKTLSDRKGLLAKVLKVIRGEAEIKEIVCQKPAPPMPPATLIIDRSTPFNPKTFIGKGWSIWRGPKDGAGLTGEEEQDKRSLALTVLHPTLIVRDNLQTGLKEGETAITGEVKLARLIVQKIQADAKFAEVLYQEEGQKTLRYLYDTLGVTWLEFLGTVLRDPDGDRDALCLYRRDSGEWDWSYRWLGRGRGASRPSLGFAS